MIFRLSRLSCFFSVVCLIHCGGAQNPESTVEESEGTSEVSSPDQAGPLLTNAEIGASVDASGLKLSTPASQEFLPDTQTVYLVASAEKLPREADIEVRWTESTMGQPLAVTHHTAGSGTYTFSSKFDLGKFVASEKKPYGRKIQALVFVNNSKIGGALFTISDRRAGGMLKVKDLDVSTSVEPNTNLAVNPSRSFRKGTKKVFASFYVGGLEPGASIRVRWIHDENTVKEDDLESEGEKRYAVSMDNGNSPIAKGDWNVEVEILGDVFAERSFFMGDNISGPAIEEASLGLSLGKDRMPKTPTTSFNTKPGAIHCGIRFIYADANSKIEIQWTSLVDGVESILETTSADVKKEGPATVNMAWRTGKSLKPGPYKAAIVVNGTKMQELSFVVE
jgi:hypothetical protein